MMSPGDTATSVGTEVYGQRYVVLLHLCGDDSWLTASTFVNFWGKNANLEVGA